MASRGVNKVILVGNLGQDPEVRYMPNGNAVANITVATSETWKDQQGQPQERTEWHRVVLYRRLAEIVGEYLRKGSKVFLEGRLQTRKWQDQSGQDRYTTEIVANELQMLDSRNQGSQMSPNQPMNQGMNAGAASNPNQGGYKNKSAFGGESSPSQPKQQQPAQNNFTPDLSDGWDDDIPF